eukprot:gene7014-8364_t
MEPAFMEDNGKFSACNLHFMDGFKDSISSGVSYYDWMKRRLQKPFVKMVGEGCIKCILLRVGVKELFHIHLAMKVVSIGLLRIHLGIQKRIRKLQQELKDCHQISSTALPRSRPGPRIRGRARVEAPAAATSGGSCYTFTTGCIPLTPASHKPRPPPAPLGPPPPIPPHVPEVTDIEDATKAALDLAALREADRQTAQRERTEFDDAIQPGGLDHLKMAFERHAPHQTGRAPSAFSRSLE